MELGSVSVHFGLDDEFSYLGTMQPSASVQSQSKCVFLQNVCKSLIASAVAMAIFLDFEYCINP